MHGTIEAAGFQYGAFLYRNDSIDEKVTEIVGNKNFLTEMNEEFFQSLEEPPARVLRQLLGVFYAQSSGMDFLTLKHLNQDMYIDPVLDYLNNRLLSLRREGFFKPHQRITETAYLIEPGKNVPLAVTVYFPSVKAYKSALSSTMSD